jgi:hypothetical protein
MIVTFYSFKGGVGRSMALANVGRWLQLRGLNVIMVDWDLEAPGLESFFMSDPAQRQAARGRLGLLDLITTYKDLYPGLPRSTASAPEDFDAFMRLLDETLPPLESLLLTLPPPSIEGDLSQPSSDPGRLRLLTAGSRSEERFATYAETVQEFDWAQFYSDFHGNVYFEWMRKQLLQTAGADIVLIDSRTGVAEMSGVSTRQLADVVVMLCAPNDQNLDGIAMMAQSIVRPDVMKARGDRRLDLMMVPARIDVSEGRPVDIFEGSFKTKLEQFTPKSFNRFGTDFTRMRIPYISAYAFSERMAVGEPDGVKSLQEAYTQISIHLALLAPAQSAIRRQCKQELQRAFGMPTVSVGSLDAEGAKMEPGVRARLEEAGLFAITLPQGPPDKWFSYPIAQGAATSIVLCLGTESLRDGRVRPLWKQALESGVCLYLVAGTDRPSSGSADCPRWPRKARLWDIQNDWDDFLIQVQRPCQATPVPFLAPPPASPLVGRESELRTLKSLLIEARGGRGAVALVGMGGMGKTALARAVCDDDDVLDFYEGGILWATLGYQADLSAVLSKLVRALEPGDSGLLDIDEAQRQLAKLLQSRSCLLVYDDIEDIAQMEILPRGGELCRVLFTTRSAALAKATGVTSVMEVGSLSSAASHMILGAELPFDAGEHATLDELSRRLGGSPIALSLANMALRARTRSEQEYVPAVSGLLRELQQSGLTAIDSISGTSGPGPIFSALNSALQLLDAADRARLPLLASLPTESPVTASVFAHAAHCTEDDARALAERMATVSMLSFDQKNNLITINPLVHEFLRGLQIRQRRVDATRIAAKAPPDRGGIYISYHREDTKRYAARLYDRLVEHFGADRVLMDIASVNLGDSIQDVIAHNLARAGAMLILIGPHWNDHMRGPSFVLLEVASALSTDIRVVPVLVGGAKPPLQHDLPPDVAPLFNRQFVEITDAAFDSDVDALAKELQYALGVARLKATSPPRLENVPRTTSVSRSVERSEAPRVRRRGTIFLAGTAAFITAATIFLTVTFERKDAPLARPPPTPNPTVSQPAGSAEFSTAERLLYGADGKSDINAALPLYQKAAELGNPAAQNRLGQMYELGEGVPRNIETAVWWYSEAAASGYPDARLALLRLRRSGPTK